MAEIIMQNNSTFEMPRCRIMSKQKESRWSLRIVLKHYRDYHVVRDFRHLYSDISLLYLQSGNRESRHSTRQRVIQWL